MTDRSPGTVGGTETDDLNHRNALGNAFPPKSRELPRSPGIPREYATKLVSGFCHLYLINNEGRLWYREQKNHQDPSFCARILVEDYIYILYIGTNKLFPS